MKKYFKEIQIKHLLRVKSKGMNLITLGSILSALMSTGPPVKLWKNAAADSTTISAE